MAANVMVAMHGVAPPGKHKLASYEEMSKEEAEAEAAHKAREAAL